MNIEDLKVGDLITKDDGKVYEVIAVINDDCTWHMNGVKASGEEIVWKNISREELKDWNRAACDCKICINPDVWPCPVHRTEN